MLTAFPLIFLTMGVPVFAAAWTWNFWEAWLFVFVFSLACTIHGLVLWKFAPNVLKRRLKAGPTAETRPVQKLIMTLVMTSFFAFLILCGLDHRFSWSHVPTVAVLFGELLIALSFYVFTKVCLENEFASATIELHEGQNVVDTGMYGLVRHPMYAGALILMLGIPLALGSLWSALFMVVPIGVLVWRISDEEKLLVAQLKGYSEYCQKVKFKMIPGVF